MKKIVLIIALSFVCVCDASEFKFHHAFQASDSGTVSMRNKDAKEIHVSKEPFIGPAEIDEFSVSYRPIRIGRHEWLHQLTITFSDHGRELFNRMVREKRSDHLRSGHIVVVLHDRIIFTHGFEAVEKKADGGPDLIMGLTLPESDYVYLSREQKIGAGSVGSATAIWRPVPFEPGKIDFWYNEASN